MSRPIIIRAFRPLVFCAALAALGGASVLAQVQAPPQQDPATASTQGQRTDGQIEMDVVKALDASSALKDDLITAATIQSEVTLSGTVASQANKDLAGSIASHVAGVTKVHNNLQIGNPQQAAQDQGFPAGDDAEAPPPATSDQAGQQNQAQQGPPPQQPDDYPQQPEPYPGQGQGQDQGAYPPPYPSQGQDQGQGGYPPPYPPPPQGRGQYPGQYPPPYGNQYPQPYPGQNRQRQAYELPRGPVTIPAGTLIQVRTAEPVSSKRAQPGTPVQFTVIRDVTYGGVLAIPRGAIVRGVVTDSRPAQTGQLGGSPQFALTLTSLDLGGKTYPLQSDLFKVKGPNKAGYTAGNVVGGAVLGAIIGGIAGGGNGAAIGAGVGAGAGTAASAATHGPDAWIPPEALVNFHLNAPVTVDPVTEQEAARLAQGLTPGGPNLYRRRRPYGPYGPYLYRPYPYYYGPRYYPYPYPPVYYRPYYMMGGVYYWR